MATPEERAARGMRAADADREKIAAELRAHCVAGRITIQELDQRVEAAISAVTLADLAEVVGDLPVIAISAHPSAAVRPPPIRPPGIRPFTQRIVLSSSLAKAYDLALDTIAPALNVMRYDLVSRTPTSLVFERTQRPAGRVAIAVLLFPIGLLALLRPGRPERITISFEARGAVTTRMTIHGTAPRQIRKQFAQLAAAPAAAR